MEVHRGRVERLKEIQSPPRAEVFEDEAVAKLEEAYRDCYPSKKFGEVSLAAADVENVVSPFEQTLEVGYQQGSTTTGDEYLLNAANAGLDKIYVVKAPPESELSRSNEDVWQHHQPESLRAYHSKLAELDAKLDAEFQVSTPLFSDAYREAIQNTQGFCVQAEHLGTPEYTVLQRGPDWWAKRIDEQASAKAGELVLAHEKLAREALELSAPMGEAAMYKDVHQALAFWKLDQAETATIVGDEPLANDQLTPNQGRRLFEVMLKRLALDGWAVVFSKGSKAINVNSNSRRVEYPETRYLSPDDIVILPPHELGVHAASGENGSRQPCPLLRTGLPDYIATQEGTTGVAEMIVGEPFGHPRQRLFAGRYLAAAMALKTVETEDGPKPKHSLQEIYNTLRGYNISAKDAGQVIWRLVRGTSLTRQVTQIPLGEDKSIPVAEAFVKDVCYFEGLVEMRDIFMQLIPLLEKEVDKQGKPAIHGKNPQDFSPQLLARVGRAVAVQNTGETQEPRQFTFEDMRQIYEAYVSLGRETLMQIVQYFIPGKLRLEDMTGGAEWKNHLRRDGLVQFSDIFTPPKR